MYSNKKPPNGGFLLQIRDLELRRFVLFIRGNLNLVFLGFAFAEQAG